MDNEEPRIEQEPKIEESSGVYLYGPYANGPDYYVQSLREKQLGSYAPKEVEETEPKTKPEGPVCPQCGNAISDDMKFCCECGFQLH